MLETENFAMMSISSETMNAAWEEWGANCGPAAISAVCGIPLAQLRPYMGDFERKRYTNPTLMWSVLKSIGVRFSYRGGELGRQNWPKYGLARIQWEGPWTRTGVPMRARYRHTHWVGVNARNPGNVGIFDCNATGNGTGWCALADWTDTIVPWIVEHMEKGADGGWHITHAVEVRP